MPAKFQSRDDALLAAEKIHARSAVSQIAHILRYLGNGALHERLFGPGQLNPVYTWMREEVVFPRIAEIVYGRSLDLPPHRIKSWNFFSCAIDEVRGEVYSLQQALTAAGKIHAKSSPKQIAHILRFLGDGAIYERMFEGAKLKPIIDLIRAGVNFSTIAEIVWRKVQTDNPPMYSISDWSYFSHDLSVLTGFESCPPGIVTRMGGDGKSRRALARRHCRLRERAFARE